MAATPLITAAEATAAVASFGSLDPSEQDRLIAAATAAINQATDRILGQTSLGETYAPERTRLIVLRQYPATAIARVATDLNPVLTIRNAGASVTRATVAFTAAGVADAPTFAGLTLAATASGVNTSQSLAFADHPTLGSLAAAIVALGGGWTADVLAPALAAGPGATLDFDGWACADLNPTLGAQDAFSAPLCLYAHTRDLPFKLVPAGARTREVQLFEGRPSGFRYPDRAYGYGGLGMTGFDTDFGSVRVDYTAGYATADVPGDLKQAACAAVQFYRDRLAASGAYQSKSVGKVAYTLAAPLSTPLPDYVTAMVAHHRRADLA